MPLPAAALLQPDSPLKPGWATFDAVWYLQAYGDALPPGMAAGFASLLGFYLARGCRVGHSPNPFFDEFWYLSAHPEVAAQVRLGRFASGFDYFCRLGHRVHSGHWLFDDALYGALHADMSPENLSAKRFFGRYDHYLRAGQFERRPAQLFFDGDFYARQCGGDAAGIGDAGPFTHFLRHLRKHGHEAAASVYFDPQWYRSRHAIAGPAIAHYLANPAGRHLDPVPEFSERFYIETNPDVKAAVEGGSFYNGYRHFLQTGVFEFRRPSESVDLLGYRDAGAAVADALNAGTVRDVFAHLRAAGPREGLARVLPATRDADAEAAAKAVFIARARASQAILSRASLDFSHSGECRLTVIMVMLDRFELSLHALSALRGNYPGDLQLILVDNGSIDETVTIERYVRGAKRLRLDRNIGYSRACNLALAAARGELVLFLHNDVELGFAAVRTAISRILSDAAIGAVGGKVIGFHGKLREAGCVISRDGSTQAYMRDASPLAPEANFVRDVDFCSGVFLLCRMAALRRVNGFDPEFNPAWYEDADLCLRLSAAGYRIVYDPAVVVFHLERGSVSEAAAKAMQRRGRQIFTARHAAFLRTRPIPGARGRTAARSPAQCRSGKERNILFIEDTVPLRRLGAGYARANDVVRALAAPGRFVSVFPVDGAVACADMARDFPERVEILHDRRIDDLAELLRERRDFYDLIWISRIHNFARILPLCLRAGIDPARIPLVLDTEALAPFREAGRRALAGSGDFDPVAALRESLRDAGPCRQCIAVNEAEAALLRGAGMNAVSVLGTMRAPAPRQAAFHARQGLLFIGAIHGPDSPNLDALHWYAREVLPALRAVMKAPPVLNFVGHVGPGIDLDGFADQPFIRLHGAADELAGHYESNRIFVAPTRFAAGTPYKLYEAASFGLPIVTTTLLAGQLGWGDEVELLAAPAEVPVFAERIARLYEAPRLWEGLREAALARIARENAPAAFAAAVERILAAAFDAPGSGTGGQGAPGDAVAI